MVKKWKIKSIVVFLVIVWAALHLPAIFYGTRDLPLHQAYVGDEQSPINGALHILESKNPLGLRNVWTVYYPPVFSIIAVPAVLADAGIKFISGQVHSAEDYKQSILFDWGGVDAGARWIALIFSTAFLFASYFFLKERSKKEGFSFMALALVGLVALNFHFFEYSAFFKHWPFVITALGFEWWSLRMIIERRGRIWWWIHGISLVFAAGISYVSLSSLIMWVPVLIGWFKEKKWCSFIPFVRMIYGVTISFLLIVLWHPIILFRYFSMVGAGENVANTLGQQNPLALSSDSVVYYLTLIVLNNLPLLIGLVFLCIALWREKIYKDIFVWSIILPGFFYFLFFAPAPHHEGRYVLPAIVSLVLVTGYLFIRYREGAHQRVLTAAIVTCLAFYAVFNSVHVGKWISVFAQGPVEKQMIDDVLSRGSNDRVLLVQDYIAGHVHTKPAYERYAADFGKSGFNLYKEILQSPSPSGVIPLNATYMKDKDFEKKRRVADSFDQVLIEHIPESAEGLLNQFDYIDENIVRMWNYYDFVPSYIRVK